MAKSYYDMNKLVNAYSEKIITQTLKKGSPLSEEELKNIMGITINRVEADYAYQSYKSLIDKNKEKLGYDSSVFLNDKGVKTDNVDPDRVLQSKSENNISSKTSDKLDYDAMVEAAYQDRLGLMTDVTGSQAQRFRDTMYGAIAQEQAVAEQSLGQAELDAYRMLGQQQLELENTIAEQRKKALLSGTTSAQLAAGQLQNMFAAQSGAAQVAQSLANQRTQMNQTYAEKRTGVETSLYDYINQQQTIAATAGAQNLAALSQYASYANKNYNDIVSLQRAATDIGTKAVYDWMEKMKAQ